jgi:hypothetical protein
MKRICKKGMKVTPEIFAKVNSQLKKHPEVCEGCDVIPCIIAKEISEIKKLLEKS